MGALPDGQPATTLVRVAALETMIENVNPDRVHALRASEAPMSSNPDGWAIALQRIAQEAKARTGTLDLGMLGLTELPEELFALTHLRELNLGIVSDEEIEAWERSGAHRSANAVRAALGRLTVFGQLRKLSVSFTDAGDLLWTKPLTGSQSLDCCNMDVRDLAPLTGLTAVQWLNCYNTRVSDLAPLKGLLALRWLACSSSPLGSYKMQVRDLAPLKGLTALQSLDCRNTRVSDLAPLKGLVALQVLRCGSTRVRHLAPLKGLTGQ